MDERAATDLNERQFAFVDQRVERGGADAAELVPGFGDRDEVPHVLLAAPRAQVEILIWHRGTFNRLCGWRCWQVSCYRFPDGLVDEVV